MKNVVFLFAVCLMAFAQAISAQESDIDLATVYKNMGDLNKAITVYTDSYEDLNEYQLYDLGVLYTTTGQHLKAVETYSSLVKEFPDFQRAYLPLAHAYRTLGRDAQAMRYYEVYGNFDPYVSDHFIESMRWAEAEQKKQDKVASRSVLSLNTINFEGFPVEYERGLVYASNRSDIKRPTAPGNSVTTQLFYTQLSGKDKTSFPAFLLKDLQPWQSIATIAVHPQSNEVIITKISQPNILREMRSRKSGMSLYIAELIDGELKHMKAMPFNSVNHNNAAAVYSSDGNTIYFMSNMKGGYGGYDIYSSTRNAGGGWMAPQNLGKEINTVGNEVFPQMIEGNLVYASDWLPGFGGYDLFQSSYKPVDSKWSEPVNLGYGVNTERDEYNLAKIHGNFYLTAVKENDNADLFSLNSFNLNQKQPDFVPTSLTLKTEDFSEAFSHSSSVKSPAESSLRDVNRIPVMVDFKSLINTDEINALQQTPVDRSKRVYSVQVAIVETGDVELLNYYGNIFSDIDAVYKVYFPEVVKVRVGNYTTYENASQTLKIIRDRGYKDAFIVEEEVVFASGDAYRDVTAQLENQKGKAINKAQGIKENDNATSSASKKVSSPSDIDFVAIGKADYKVRLATYSEPKWFNPDKVNHLGHIQRFKKGEWTIFLLGDYLTVEDAAYVQELAVKNGYAEAQIVRYVDGDFIKVK